MVSILRGYVLRRLFNRYTSVEPVPEDTYIGTVTSFITANSPADISMVANEMRELPKTSG